MEGWGTESIAKQTPNKFSKPDIILFLFSQDPWIALFNRLSVARLTAG
jgi:hypothetical protein